MKVSESKKFTAMQVWGKYRKERRKKILKPKPYILKIKKIERTLICWNEYVNQKHMMKCRLINVFIMLREHSIFSEVLTKATGCFSPGLWLIGGHSLG